MYYLFVVILALLTLIKLCKASVESRSRRHLQLPPCPWNLPLIGSIHHLVGDLPHRALCDLSRRQGPIMSLKFGGVPFIVVSSPEAAKDVMNTHDTIFATRPQSEITKIITSKGQGLVFAPYGDQWRELRKTCIRELLSTKQVQSFRAIQEEAARLVRSISSAQGSLVNLSQEIARYATDASVHIIMGRRFKDQADYDKFQYYQDQGFHLALSFCLPNLYPSLQLGRTLSKTVQKAEIYREEMFEFIGGLIHEHQERRLNQVPPCEENLIDVLLKIQSGEGYLQCPVSDILAGGRETVATVLQWAMAELMRNHAAMSKVQAEVRGAFTGRTKIIEEGLGELTYLQFVIKETLRLHIPGPLFMRECQESCKVMGYDVPSGTKVLLNLWAIARDPKYWDEPETFKPERFETDARDFRGNCFEFMPFGSGRRMCPGMSFGLANVEVALAKLLFYFDWSLPAGVHPRELDMTESMGVTVQKKEALLVQASLRVQLSD
ncbi:hypothetical protein U9M48_004443 [Paspalum notatum var. saurae]|uniref:Cytochrome P450 n=1 Tax=Paspalum notatum var. saurae TaxID=547442 RepID=A0AAQ3SEU4_PASNO